MMRSYGANRDGTVLEKVRSSIAEIELQLLLLYQLESAERRCRHSHVGHYSRQVAVPAHVVLRLLEEIRKNAR